MSGESITVVILAFGDEPFLAECVARVLAAETGAGNRIDIVLVDNGSAAVAALGPDPRLRILRPPRNLGFAGGCNLGAAESAGSTLVFLNSDALIEPGSVRRLVAALAEPGVGVVTGDIRLAATPDLMNSAGNPVHFLGFVWAGAYAEPATSHREPVDVASASGAFFAVRRSLWNSLGGFDEAYFAYHEDTELSLRTWQRGLRVRYVPNAVALHHYEFSRNPNKQYLLERNRWITVLTVFPRPVLAWVVPAMVVFDLALCAVAAMQGWLPAKLRGWAWLISHRGDLRARRRQVQACSTMTTGEFVGLLAARIEPPVLERPPGLDTVNRVLGGYWALARRRLTESRESLK